MVLPDSHGVPRAPRYSGTGSRRYMHFVYGAITNRPHNPSTTEVVKVWALPLSLAATYGITIVFFSWGYLDVSVPPVRPAYLCIQHAVTEHYLRRVAPFGNLRVKACLAAHRSLSQLTTSFIAFLCLGIHRTPLVA